MAKPIKFAHVVYQTRRFDEMIDWYVDVFEGHAVHRDPALAFITYDEEHHRMAIANLDVFKPAGGEAGRGEIGVNHVAYTYASVRDLLDTYARLKARGILPYWSIHHGITLSNYYQDPDGNRMEFQVDCGSEGFAADYMAGPAFAANPVGVPFDPEELAARLAAGASEAELLAMPAGQMSPIPAAHGLG